jgi:hypothetical protein
MLKICKKGGSQNARFEFIWLPEWQSNDERVLLREGEVMAAKQKKPEQKDLLHKEVRVTIRFSSSDAEALRALSESQLQVTRSSSALPGRKKNLAETVREAVRRQLAAEELEIKLESIEARLAASLIRTQGDIAKVHEDCQLLIGVIDQLVRFVLTTTPELVDKETAALVGERRYNGFLEELHKTMLSRGKRARLSETLSKENLHVSE